MIPVLVNHCIGFCHDIGGAFKGFLGKKQLIAGLDR